MSWYSHSDCGIPQSPEPKELRRITASSETGDRGEERGERREDKRQETGDRRQEAGGRRQGTYV